MSLEGTFYIEVYPEHKVESVFRDIETYAHTSDYDFSRHLPFAIIQDSRPDPANLKLQSLSKHHSCIILIHEYYEGDDHSVSAFFNGEVLFERNLHQQIKELVPEEYLEKADFLHSEDRTQLELAHTICLSIGSASDQLSFLMHDRADHTQVVGRYMAKAKNLIDKYDDIDMITDFVRGLK